MFNCNGGRESVNQIDIWLGPLVKKLTSVCGERLDVASPPLSVKRVERQRGLPRARNASNDDEFIPGDIDIDIFEIVLARAADADEIHSIKLSKQEVGLALPGDGLMIDSEGETIR